MRAVIVKDGKGPIENLYVGEIEKPSPRQGEVLVKIKAFGLNRMDILQRNGNYPLPPGAPDTLGVEFSGTVAEIGEGSGQRFAVGDEVIGLASGVSTKHDLTSHAPQGAYAEYIRLLETHVLPKPKNLTWEEAASIPENFLTAYQALIVIAQLKKGEDVLVHAGASGVGIAAIQLARLYGAKTITATTSNKEKIDYLLQMPNGATHGVNYKTQNFDEEVKKTTGGKGVDVIIDFVGKSHWHKNIEAFARDGRMTILATLSGGLVDNVNISPILYKRLRIEGSTLRSRSPEYQADLIAKRDVLGEFTVNGQIRTSIHEVFPLEKIQEAHRVMEADKNIGKLVVTVS
ncbi:quinone oxidoreductase [Cytidiella melzeri]|nr:quinone oxidoreductase [Cytidiella melzeri]